MTMSGYGIGYNPPTGVVDPGSTTYNNYSTSGNGGNLYGDIFGGGGGGDNSGGGGFNWNNIGNILNGGLGLYGAISGINQNNQLGSGLSNLFNTGYGNFSGLSNQYGQYGAPLINQLGGIGSNTAAGLSSFLTPSNIQSLLTSLQNPNSAQNIAGANAAAQGWLSAAQPGINAIGNNLFSQANQVAQNAETSFGLTGQPLQGTGGAANAFGGIYANIPGAVASQEGAALLPGLSNAFGMGLQAQYGAPLNTISGINSLFQQPNQAANLFSQIPGQANNYLQTLGNMLNTQQQQYNQSQANSYAQNSAGSGGGLGGFLGPLLGGIGSIFGGPLGGIAGSTIGGAV